MVRLGIPQSGHMERLTEKCPLVLLDKIAAKLGESLSEEKNNLVAEKTRLESILDQYETVFHAIQTARTLSSDLSALKSELSELTNKLSVANNELKRLEEAQIKNKEKLIEARSSGKLKRFFSGLDPQKIQREIDQTSIMIDSKKRLAQEITARIPSLKNLHTTKEKETERAKTEADNLLNRLRVSVSEIDNKKKEITARKDTILARLAEINQ